MKCQFLQLYRAITSWVIIPKRYWLNRYRPEIPSNYSRRSPVTVWDAEKRTPARDKSLRWIPSMFPVTLGIEVSFSSQGEMCLQGGMVLFLGQAFTRYKKQVILSDPVSMPQKPRALPPNSQSYGETLPERAEALQASVVRSRCWTCGSPGGCGHRCHWKPGKKHPTGEPRSGRACCMCLSPCPTFKSSVFGFHLLLHYKGRHHPFMQSWKCRKV